MEKPFPKKVYLGLAEGKWKSRFYNHKLSFKHKRYSNKTTLSSEMWHLKRVSSETHILKWSFWRCLPLCSNISKKCALCLYEKLEIVTYQNQKELMNKRSELLCKCRHANKFPLKNYTGNHKKDNKKLKLLVTLFTIKLYTQKDIFKYTGNDFR